MATLKQSDLVSNFRIGDYQFKDDDIISHLELRDGMIIVVSKHSICSLCNTYISSILFQLFNDIYEKKLKIQKKESYLDSFLI